MDTHSAQPGSYDQFRSRKARHEKSNTQGGDDALLKGSQVRCTLACSAYRDLNHISNPKGV